MRTLQSMLDRHEAQAVACHTRAFLLKQAGLIEEASPWRVAAAMHWIVAGVLRRSIHITSGGSQDPEAVRKDARGDDA